jgi:hypothetical protein
MQLRSEVPPRQDEQGEFEHIITMCWEREKAKTLKIRVPLTPVQYQPACGAHKEGRRIKILGIPGAMALRHVCYPLKAAESQIC